LIDDGNYRQKKTIVHSIGREETNHPGNQKETIHSFIQESQEEEKNSPLHSTKGVVDRTILLLLISVELECLY
jgi:hypothetical protein